MECLRITKRVGFGLLFLILSYLYVSCNSNTYIKDIKYPKNIKITNNGR